MKFTPKYPQEIPQLQLREPSGLSETNVEELLEELQQMVWMASSFRDCSHHATFKTTESLGMAVIFTLTGHLKERMDQVTQDKVQAKLLLQEEARRIEEEVRSFLRVPRVEIIIPLATAEREPQVSRHGRHRGNVPHMENQV